MTSTLYEADFVRWTTEQANALRDLARVGSNLALDWENLAEEIESLGRSQRSELRSRIRTIIRHLLKLEISPATEPRAGWRETVRNAQAESQDLLTDSPSLEREVASVIAEQRSRAAEMAYQDLRDHGEDHALADFEAVSFTEERVLGPALSHERDD